MREGDTLTRSEPTGGEVRTAAGQFLQNGLEALGFAEDDAREAIVAIEAEAAEAAAPEAGLPDGLDVRGGCYFCGATGPAPHAGCPAGNVPQPTDEDIEQWYRAFEKVSGSEAKTLQGRRAIFDDFAAEYARLRATEPSDR